MSLYRRILNSRNASIVSKDLVILKNVVGREEWFSEVSVKNGQYLYSFTKATQSVENPAISLVGNYRLRRMVKFPYGLSILGESKFYYFGVPSAYVVCTSEDNARVLKEKLLRYGMPNYNDNISPKTVELLIEYGAEVHFDIDFILEREGSSFNINT